MMKRTSTVILLVLFTALAGCNDDFAYSETESLPAEGWSVGDTLHFDPVLEEAGARYDVNLWVRHTKGYAYSNIWVKVLTDASLLPDSTGLVEIPLADKTGRWLGQCSQSYCTAGVALGTGLQFKDAAAFRFDVVQYMREEVLEGVRDVGLEIVRSSAE